MIVATFLGIDIHHGGALLVLGFLCLLCNSAVSTNDCVNVWKNSWECDDWARHDQCDVNPQWMLPNCKKSCLKCDQYDCNNAVDTSSKCRGWADTGECEVNEGWMVPNCRYACLRCEKYAAPGIFVSNETHVLKLQSETRKVDSIISQGACASIVGVAVDGQSLFWSDISDSHRGLYSSDYSGQRKIISEDILEVNGIALDWLSKHVYWTDSQTRRIEVADYDGTNRRVLVNTGLFSPSGIVADPVNGYLYWNDQGTKKIERSRLDGSQREVLVDSGLTWPNQMAMDYSTGNLYWVDAWNKTLQYLTPGGTTVQVADLAGYVGSNPAFGLSLLGGMAYVSVWGSGKILSVAKTGGQVSTEFSDLGSAAMFSISSFNRSELPEIKHPCSFPRKGGCSHLCLPTVGQAYHCACPSKGGLVLSPGGTTCKEPDNVLLYTVADQSEVGFIDPDNPGTGDRYLVGRSSRPVAVTFDPVTQRVYWSDVQERTVYRAFLNGTSQEVFLNASQGLGFVDGLALDWIHRKLYFTNEDFVTIDSTAFTWHKIEMIDLDTPMGNYGNSAAVNQWASRGRTAIVTNVEKPRGLWLDMEQGYLYYTDWGSRGTVTRTNLDGRNPLLLQSGMDNPNSVLLEKDQLFVVDSHAKKWEDGTAEKKGSLYFRNISREGWNEDKGPQLKVPYGMAKNGDLLYISDWGHKAILEYNMKNGTQRPLVAAGGDVMALLFTKTVQNAGSDKCRSSSCDQICITEPQTGTAQCHCSSYGFYTSASDSQTCTGFSVQSDFAVFADMSSIKKVDLPVQGKPQISTLYEGNKYFSTYTGLVYDKSGQQVLFSDTTKKSIYQLNLKTGGASIYYQPCQVVDSMYLEPTAGTTRQLYWTASEAGIIASLPYSSPSLNHTVVVSGLDKPRAVTVIGEYIYWTEWGTKARVARVNKKGGNITTVLGTGLIRPSGLDYDSTSGKLYISDGHTGQIFRCYATGNPACEAVQVGSGKLGQIYDFVVNGQMLIYTDWRSHSVSAMDLQTGITRGLADGLMRPSQLALSGFISKVFVTIPAVVSSPTPGVTSSSGRTPTQTTTTTKTLSSPEPVLLVTPTKAADTSLPTSQAVGTSLQGHKSTVLVDRTTLLHSKQVPGFTSSKSTHIASLSTNLPDVTTPQVLIPSTSRSSTAASPGDTASTRAVFVTEVETTAKRETEPMTRKMSTPTKTVMTTKPVEAVGTTEGPSVTTLKAEALATTQRETKLPRTAPVQVPANATEQYIGTTEADLAESTSRAVMETTGTLEATSGRAKKTTLEGTSAIETDEPLGTGRTHVTTQSSLVFSSPSTTVTVTSQKAVQVSEAGKGTAEGVQTTFVLPKITTSILSVTNGTQVDITQKLSRQPILSSLGITTESSRTSVSRQGTTASSAGTKVPVIPVVTEQIPTRAATLSSSSVRAKPEITTKVSKPASTEAQMSTFVVESTEDFATSGKSTSKVIPTAILTEPEVRVGTTVGKSTTRTTTGRESTSKESHRSTSIQVTVETEFVHSTEQPKLTGVPHSSKTPDVVITEEGMRTSTAVPIKTRPGVSVVTDLKHTISQLPKTSLPSAVKENTTLLPSVPMKTTVSEAVQPPVSTLGVELGSTAGPVAHATTAGVETTAEGTTTTVAVSTQSPATSPEQPTTEHPPFSTVAVSTQSPATSPEQPTSEHPPFSTMKQMPTEPARPVVPTRADKENITMTAKPAENVTKISVSVTETPAMTHQVDSTVVTGLATRRGTSAAAGTTVHLLTSKTSKIPDATPTTTVLPMVNTSIDSERQRNRSTIALKPTVLVSEKTTVVSSPLTTTLSTTQAIKSTVPVEETTVAVLPPTTESTSRLMTTDQGLQTTQKLTYVATTEASTTLSMAQATEETTQKATYPTTTETHTTVSMMQETTGMIHRTISKTTLPLTAIASTKATTTTRPSTSKSAESTSTQLPESTVRKETTPEMRVQSTEVAETTKREASTRTPVKTTTRQIIVTEKPVMSSEGSTGVVTTTTTYTSTTAGKLTNASQVPEATSVKPPLPPVSAETKISTRKPSVVPSVQANVTALLPDRTTKKSVDDVTSVRPAIATKIKSTPTAKISTVTTKYTSRSTPVVIDKTDVGISTDRTFAPVPASPITVAPSAKLTTAMPTKKLGITTLGSPSAVVTMTPTTPPDISKLTSAKLSQTIFRLTNTTSSIVAASTPVKSVPAVTGTVAALTLVDDTATTSKIVVPDHTAKRSTPTSSSTAVPVISTNISTTTGPMLPTQSANKSLTPTTLNIIHIPSTVKSVTPITTGPSPSSTTTIPTTTSVRTITTPLTTVPPSTTTLPPSTIIIKSTIFPTTTQPPTIPAPAKSTTPLTTTVIPTTTTHQPSTTTRVAPTTTQPEMPTTSPTTTSTPIGTPIQLVQTTVIPSTKRTTTVAVTTTGQTTVVSPTTSTTTIPSTTVAPKSQTTTSVPSTSSTTATPTTTVPPTTRTTTVPPTTTSQTTSVAPTTRTTTVAPTTSQTTTVVPTTRTTTVTPTTSQTTTVAPTSSTTVAPTTSQTTTVAPTTRTTTEAPTTSQTTTVVKTTRTTTAAPTTRTTTVAPTTSQSTTVAPTTSQTTTVAPTTSQTTTVVQTTSSTTVVPTTTSRTTTVVPTTSTTTVAPTTGRTTAVASTTTSPATTTSTVTPSPTTTVPTTTTTEAPTTRTSKVATTSTPTVPATSTVAPSTTSTTAVVLSTTMQAATSTESPTTAGRTTMPRTTTITMTTKPRPTGPPPKFTFCPQNKTIISGGDTKEVWWQEPQVQDFNGSAVKQIDVNIQPGSVFKIGQTLVTYTATDRYGSTATCSFTVDIQRAKFDCTGTPAPNNGQLNCRRIDYLFHCQLSCNEGYRKNSQYDYTYVCRIAGWAPTFDPSFGTMACLKLTPLSYSQSLTIQFNGDCGKNEANFKQQMTEALIADFKAKKLCGSTKGSDPHGLCSPKNIAVVCGSSGGRQRRQTQGNGGIAVTFKVATQAGNSTAQKKGQAQLQELLENIRSMVSNNNLKLIVGDQQVVATGSTLGPAQQGCTWGSEQVENGCMVCAMGGHQNATGQCEACPAGTYQDKAAQTSCISCPQGTKSQRGSFTKAQCVSPQETTVKPTSVSSKGRDQLEAWVVITICAVAGVIILISIIVCAIWIGRNLKHKYTGKMKMDHEKGIPNGRHVNYHNPAFVARPKSETTEKKTKDDTMPKYLVAQAPPQNLPQYRYQQLKPGTIVKVIPLENGGRKIVVVPKKPHSKKYEMKEAAKVTVSMQPDPAVQGKYIKNQGPPLAAAQAVPVVKVPVAAKPVPAQQKRSKGWTSLTDTDKTST